MKKLFIFLAVLASVSFAGMVNIQTQSTTPPNPCNGIYNPTHDILIENGWRDMLELPAVSNGFERLSVTWGEGDGMNARAVYADTLITDRLAAEAIAASNAAYQASLPRQEPTGIEAPVVVLIDSDGKGWGVVADGGDLVTYQDHASPRPDAATIAARIAAARATNAQLRAHLGAVRTNTTQNISDCQVLTATHFTGGAKETINAMQAEMVDMNRQLQALRQIVAQHIRSEP